MRCGFYLFFLLFQIGVQGETKTVSEGVYLLKFPYPYKSAFTVFSRLDEGKAENFESIHTLVNMNTLITHDSRIWQVLFKDPEIKKREAWRKGINGFGLPIGDTIFFRDKDSLEVNIFKDFDKKTGKLVLNTYKGEDFSKVFDRWRRNGWLDTLHTPGVGDNNTREFTEAALKWLKNQPHGDMKVWVDHRVTINYTCLGKTGRTALPYIIKEALPCIGKNFVKSGIFFLRKLGISSLAQGVSNEYTPWAFPYHQGAICWFLMFLVVAGTFWLVFCIFFIKLRKKWNFILGISLCVGVTGILYFLPLNYGQGANPQSPYYCGDLLHKYGFRYFAINMENIISETDNRKLNKFVLPERSTKYPESFVLPEHSINGRISPLYVQTLDDGLSYLSFMVVYKIVRRDGLELLTDDVLNELCDSQSWVFLNTEWTSVPQTVFTAKALDGLERLKQYYHSGRIWVAPASEFLDFAFFRTFLEYKVLSENGKRVIDILRVNDPTGKPFVPNLTDLRGISFECSSGLPTEIRLAGIPVPKENIDWLDNGERKIIRFPLKR